MRSTKEEALGLLRDLFTPEQVEAEERRARELEETPIYERGGARAFSRHWVVAMPPKIARLAQQYDLAATLRNANYELLAARPRRDLALLDSLSATLNSLRRAVTERPLLCDVEHFYRYAFFLKWLNKWFYNTNVSLVSYFAMGGGAEEEKKEPSPAASCLIMEYINVLLLLFIRLSHEAYQARECDAKEAGQKMRLCEMLLAEADECATYATGPRFAEAGDKWFYQLSPQSISSGSGGSAATGSSTAEASPSLAEDKTRLQRYVREELCGVVQIRARTLLFGAKADEMRVRVLEEHAAAEELAERYDTVLGVIVPLVARICTQYEAAADLLYPAALARRKRKQRLPRLASYALFMSHYWFVRAQLALVEAERELYERDEVEEAVAHGKCALKRVEAVLSEVETMHETVARARLDAELRGDYEALLARTSFYPELYRTITSAYNYDPERIELPDEEAAQPPPLAKKSDFAGFMRDRLNRYMEADPEAMAAFELLKALYAEERAGARPFQASPSPAPLPAPDPEEAMRRAVDEARAAERLAFYEWLFTLRDSRGRVAIPADHWDEMEAEYEFLLDHTNK
jgi:hypothetical protein